MNTDSLIKKADRQAALDALAAMKYSGMALDVHREDIEAYITLLEMTVAELKNLLEGAA